MYGADGEPMGDANTTTIKFETPDAPACTGGEAKDPEKKEIEVKAGKFACISYDGSNWMMEKYPGVIVKSDSMELIEWNE
jgi:hypothetical protein